jgi:DNA-binding transcriptional ArsR family regulator
VAEADIPRAVKRFLRRHITTLYQLEILLLLYEKRATACSLGEISRALHIGEAAIETWLAEFRDQGFVDYIEQPEKSYGYHVSDETDEIMGALVKTYRERRVSVTTFIYSTPLDNVRRFADAFRLKKDE